MNNKLNEKNVKNSQAVNLKKQLNLLALGLVLSAFVSGLLMYIGM